MVTMTTKIAIMTLSMVLLTCVGAQAQETKSQEDVTYRIEFLSKNFPDAWVKVASQLLEKKLAPLNQVQVQPGEGSCSAVLRALNFRAQGVACSDALQTLINKLNSQLPKTIPVGATVTYPDLPVQPLMWRVTFDKSLPAEAARLKAVMGGWTEVQIEQKQRGSQVQLRLPGFQTEIKIPKQPAAIEALQSIERFDSTINRLAIRVVPLTDEPIAKSPYSVETPSGWYRQCRSPDGAQPPKPPYVTLLGASANLPCVKSCAEGGNRCPEIVLLDKEIKPHPDIAGALGLPASSAVPELCPDVAFDITQHHATHLAGIMVSADRAGSFPGLAPAATLDNRNYDKLRPPDLVALIRDKSSFNNTRSIIFVFASKFNNTDNRDIPLSDPRLRVERPAFIRSIINEGNLWVVAAGEDKPPKSLGMISPDSPMNLGDLSNVLVVTACENCFTESVSLSSWANSSQEGLVNVAAPGGTEAEGIPGPASASQYAVAHGTSQSAALVGGLAAAMLSCYPDAYKNARTLKIRIQATARPPMQPEVAPQLSSGIVDASKALLDPQFHWVTLVNQRPRKAVELQWCRQHIALKNPENDDILQDGLFSAKQVRQILRRQAADQRPVWYFMREPEEQKAAAIISAGPAALLDPSPLLRIKYDDGSLSNVIRLDDVESLFVGLQPNAKNFVVKPELCRP